MNKLIIAAAGAGKTTFLVNEALKQKNEKILITTYTDANEEEIRKKIIKINKCIPENITIQTWFSFLLHHGVRPYQRYFIDRKIAGVYLINKQVNCYIGENNIEKYYFTEDLKIYSDKLSKFVFRCNEKSNGAVIDRISKIYSHIFIDEVQDLAGYDLDFIKLLFNSPATILLVGDPRQVTYLTHNEKRYAKYKNGHIKEFILQECKGYSCEIDECSLNLSHRNNKLICDFAAKLYPVLPICESKQDKPPTQHDGIFLVKRKDANYYLQKYKPVQLRYNKSIPVNEDYEVKNFGESKGLGFDRVLIYPTKPIIQFLKDGNLKKYTKNRKTGQMEETLAFDIAKFYVAITRARFSVGIICDYGDEAYIDGINKFEI